LKASFSQLHSLEWLVATQDFDDQQSLGDVLAAASQLTRLHLGAHPREVSQRQLSVLTALRCCSLQLRDGEAEAWDVDVEFFALSLRAPDVAWMTRLTQLRLCMWDMSWGDLATAAAAGHLSALRSLHLHNEGSNGPDMFQTPTYGGFPVVRLEHLTRLHVLDEGQVVTGGLIGALERCRLPALAVLEVTMTCCAGVEGDDACAALWQQHLEQVVRRVVAPALVRLTISAVSA
jgi:hypothetical protein